MSLKVEDLGDQTRYRHILTIKYDNLVDFVFEYLGKRSLFISSYFFFCILSLIIAITLRIRIAGEFTHSSILLHSLTGFVFLPLVCVPLHEFLHAIPLLLSGAKNVRAGIDLKQFMFYVSAHRYVASAPLFRIVALTPFILISLSCGVVFLIVPALWKWTIASFLFTHTTMCAGDFALLNFYYLNRHKKIYTWDDLEKKEAYFYEETA
jgi:hypothetical protein